MHGGGWGISSTEVSQEDSSDRAFLNGILRDALSFPETSLRGGRNGVIEGKALARMRVFPEARGL